jgi:hypothetical protein
VCGQQAILAKKRFEQEQDKEKEDQKKKILEMYGAEKFQKPVDARLRLGQTEAYVSTKITHEGLAAGSREAALPRARLRGSQGDILSWCVP